MVNTTSRTLLVALAIATALLATFIGLFAWSETKSPPDSNTLPSPSPSSSSNTIVFEEFEDIYLTPYDRDLVRNGLRDIVNSVPNAYRDRLYYQDASLQPSQWLVCTIVEQCLVPKYGLAVKLLTPDQVNTLFVTSKRVMTDMAYKMLLQQIQSNLILGQYQEHTTKCDGKCRQYKSPTVFSMLNEYEILEDVESFEECGEVAENTTVPATTTWICDDVPMALFGNMDTNETLEKAFRVNDIFVENEVHPRGDVATYLSIYGSLTGSGQFGFRYSAHHIDINYIFYPNGTIETLPAFLGHNPLAVLPISPKNRESEIGNDQWTNLKGINLHPSSVEFLFEAFDKAVPVSAFVPLSDFDSTPSTGGLTLKNGLELMSNDDVPNALNLNSIEQDTFDTIWRMMAYTLTLVRPRMSDFFDLKDEFQSTGRLIWSSFSNTDVPNTPSDLVTNYGSYYIRVETDDHLFFTMVNQMFTFASLAAPSNHLHSLFIPKSYLASTLDADQSAGDPWPNITKA